MNVLLFFLAQRLFLKNNYQKNISTVAIICFMGIFIGSFSLAVVTAIMRGFEVAIHKKIQGIHAHIIIDAYGKPINFKALSQVLRNEFPEIAAFSPHAERHALIRIGADNNNIPHVIMIKSINPELEMQTSSLFTKIIQPISKKNFTDLLQKNHIIIGKQYATSNSLTIGDTVELIIAHDEQIKGNTATFDSVLAIVGGIFDTGIDEFDSNIIYCSFSFLKNIFSNISTEQVNIKLHNEKDEANVIKKLHKRLGFSVYSWKDLYPSLVATLKLEKYVSFFIIALIVFVASMNIISLLYMLITQKRHDIALLKSMGMPNNSIRLLFFIAGFTITLLGAICGLICALIFSYGITLYPCISLPDTYYVTHLPIIMEISTLIYVLCVVLLCSIISLYYSTQQINYINISHVLRFED